jgi:hypothetical protein
MTFTEQRLKTLELPLDEKISYESTFSRIGLTVNEVVSETLSSWLIKKNKYYTFTTSSKNLKTKLRIFLVFPLGTVKSRLYTARQRFREKYPYPPISKGEKYMSKFPDIMPDVRITKINKPPFHVVWEEAMGWFIIPKLGEKISWAMYDYPQKTRSGTVDLAVVGKAVVHGIEGVEIVAVENNPKGFDALDSTSEGRPHLCHAAY